jgi:DNA invertase Pin-like site-specific DNA recombinase
MQIDAIKKVGVEERFIYQEKVSGTRTDRPELDKLLKIIQEGDTVIVWKLDRIGRSMKHLIELIDSFQEKGINFISLHENIDTTTATGKLVFRIFASLAEFERDMISERTKAGLEAARARGRKGGRKAKDSDIKRMALKMYDSKEYTIKEIHKATGVSPTSLYRYIEERK